MDEVKIQQIHKPQTKRTTFRLPQSCIDQISWLSKSTDLRVRDIFEGAMAAQETIINIVEHLSEERRGFADNQGHQRKTYVLTKTQVNWLNRFSERYSIERDFLVWLIVTLVVKTREKELEDQPEYEKKTVEMLRKIEQMMLDLETSSGLRNDHPMMVRLGLLIVQMNELTHHCDQYLDNGKPIPSEIW